MFTILDSTFVIHEDQVSDRVGVEKLIFDVIFYEYMWEFEE